MTLTDGIGAIFNDAKSLLSNPVATAVGGAVLGSAVTGAVIAGVTSSKKRSRKKSSKKRSTKRKSKKKKKTKYARTAGKGRDRSTKRIRMTKSGQPYIILASGKARFISKASARNSRRRKGGRY